MAVQSAESDAYARWTQTRLDRILVDYMLRQGYSETAKKLAYETYIMVGADTLL